MSLKFIASLKKIDALTHHKVGGFFRELTNINTSSFWDKKFSSPKDCWRDEPYAFIGEFLPRDREFTLLDLGCALGDGCIFLRDKFPKAKISGLDFSAVAVSKARNKAPDIDFFISDILKFTPEKKYDYILMVHILEHFNRPYEVVDKYLRFINTALIIEVPYTKEFLSPYLYARGQHRYLFNEKSFLGYKHEILKITGHIERAGYPYIIFKLTKP
jgi:2-polyprenyl-3-methyl-5-hydroxy-6-metoxy-1,4-benzoquinol methylase